MTLQSDLAFPRGDLLGELIFFLTPLLGLALIFQSVLNFGRLLLDKGSRREAWQVALASTYRNHVHLQETFSDVVKTDKTGLSKTAHTRWMISAFANFLPGSTIFRLA